MSELDSGHVFEGLANIPQAKVSPSHNFIKMITQTPLVNVSTISRCTHHKDLYRRKSSKLRASPSASLEGAAVAEHPKMDQVDAQGRSLASGLFGRPCQITNRLHRIMSSYANFRSC